MTPSMNIGFIQFAPEFGEKERNLNRIRQLLRGISADIIVLPELFNTGYTFLNKKELEELAELAKDGDTSRFMSALARETKCAYAYGFAEKDSSLFYDSMNFVTPDGFIHTYRKAHLFSEEKYFFAPGNTPFQVFEYKNTKLGMLICFDWIYPEAARTLALKGSQIILHCANLILPYCPDAMVTRAIENRVFIVTCDRIGTEKRNGKNNIFIGKSEIVSPKGEILIRVNDEECVKIVEIDPGLALNKKATSYNDIFAERREDLYFK